ncbi:MAG: His-Xaa-Ser system protein HxsD [Candidatus Omnitrophota bacterium]|jgi:His-Xaa-Ser system protein HxsD|nr:MAG: His-Xaa-Ser system protein HxsD [Candidatus Omnitrophota bacterium]
MEFELNTEIYPKDVIMETCFRYLDRVFVYLDKGSNGTIKVYIQPKNTANRLTHIKEEFLNDLIYTRVRYQIHNNNKNITEFIIKRALYSATLSEEERLKVLENYIKNDSIGKSFDDPEGIAVPWEEKFAHNKADSKHKSRPKKHPAK